jgi:hypothetical protein
LALQARLVEAAKSGKTIKSDTMLREARAAELEAQDQLEVAEAALAEVEESVGGPEHESAEVRARLAKYADGVVLTRAEPLLEETKALHDKLIANRIVLRYMLHELKPHGAHLQASTDEAAKAIHDFLRNEAELPGSYGSVQWTEWDRHPAANPWRAAREALMKDAEAPLPEG